jgi:prepilin-type N-terminal cleavage/methylation domain-containing protein
MFTKPGIHSKRAFTLVEMAVAVGVFAIGSAMALSVFVFCLRSFAAMSNYAILDMENRQALDKLTREIRQAQEVTSYSTNPPSLTILGGSGSAITYAFDPTQKIMTRLANGTRSVLLTNCSLLNFNLYQRNPVGGSYDIYPVASSNWQATVKVVELSWKTRRTLGGTGIDNSENIQTARIVIRNQQEN